MPTISGVTFVPQSVAESMPSAPDVGIISITCPGEQPAMLADGWASVLRVEFFDVIPGDIWTTEEGIEAMDEDQAKQIVAWLNDHEDEMVGVVVHCRAGISRSAAVAQFITDRYSLGSLRGADRYNTHVYRLLANEYFGPIVDTGELE